MFVHTFAMNHTLCYRHAVIQEEEKPSNENMKLQIHLGCISIDRKSHHMTYASRLICCGHSSPSV